jgi:hypothetical protein
VIKADCKACAGLLRFYALAGWTEDGAPDPLVSHTSAGEILGALCGAMTLQQAGGLADLDQVSVRVPQVAADLRSPSNSHASVSAAS